MSVSSRQGAFEAFRNGRVEEALALLEQLCAEQGAGEDWLALGRLKHHLGDLAGALAALQNARTTTAVQLEAVRSQAHVLVDLGRAAEACTLIEGQLVRAPDDLTLRVDHAIASERAGRASIALRIYDEVLLHAPADPRARLNRAALLRDHGRFEEALRDYAALSDADDSNPGHWCAQAECLRQMGRSQEALACCRCALDRSPDCVGALMCKGVILASLGDIASAQSTFDHAWRADPIAAARYGNERSPAPEAPDARTVYIAAAFARLRDADWRQFDEFAPACAGFFADPERAPSDLSMAFPLLYLSAANAIKSAAHATISRRLAALTRPMAAPAADGSSRLRIAYVSSKFRAHPAMVLTHGLFRAHDRARFEVSAYALNADDGSVQRQQVAAEFDRFVEVAGLSDDSIARRIRADGIDILVDLDGYSDDTRPGVLARKPAPLQIAYLGHSHSLFAPWIDYRITDTCAEPETWGHPLSEARAFVSPTFYCYGHEARTDHPRPERATLGLPDDAFVLCAFGRVEKIDPHVFRAWLALLRSLPDAVLWLGPCSERPERALRTYALERGVAAERLVFARQLDHAAHVARHGAADLYLDTWSFNAHTTALDALHGGLPMVTRRGDSWSARIGASLLTAAGLQELVTDSGEEYVDLALALAADSVRLRALKKRLRETLQLLEPFAPARSVPRLEAVFVQAWTRHRAGERPVDFTVG